MPLRSEPEEAAVAEVLGTYGGVGGGDAHRLHGDAEAVGRDLAHLAVQALAHLRAAVVERDRAVLVDVHQRARLVEMGEREADAEHHRGERDAAAEHGLRGVPFGDPAAPGGVVAALREVVHEAPQHGVGDGHPVIGRLLARLGHRHLAPRDVPDGAAGGHVHLAVLGPLDPARLRLGGDRAAGRRAAVLGRGRGLARRGDAGVARREALGRGSCGGRRAGALRPLGRGGRSGRGLRRDRVSPARTGDGGVPRSGGARRRPTPSGPRGRPPALDAARAPNGLREAVRSPPHRPVGTPRPPPAIRPGRPSPGASA